LNGYCDHISPIDEDELSWRRSSLGKQITASNSIAYIVEPGASMKYLSSVSWKVSERPFLLVIHPDGSHFFVSPSYFYFYFYLLFVICYFYLIFFYLKQK